MENCSGENVLGLREARASSVGVGVVDDAVESQNCDLAKQYGSGQKSGYPLATNLTRIGTV